MKIVECKDKNINYQVIQFEPLIVVDSDTGIVLDSKLFIIKDEDVKLTE